MKALFSSGKRIFAFVAGLIGLAAGTIGVLQYLEPLPSEIWIVKRDGNEIMLTPQTVDLGGVYQADKITLSGTLETENDVALIANEIKFADSSSLTVSGGNITVLATQFNGGVVSVSGKDGNPGAQAGTIFAVGAMFNNPRFVADGGNALSPETQKGGIDFSCDDAEDKGVFNGGNGGMVRIYGHPQLVTTTYSVEGGEGNAKASNDLDCQASRGVLGFGLSALGVAQTNDSESQPEQINGQDGNAESRHIEFRNVGPFLEKQLKNGVLDHKQARLIAEQARNLK